MEGMNSNTVKGMTTRFGMVCLSVGGRDHDQVIEHDGTNWRMTGRKLTRTADGWYTVHGFKLVEGKTKRKCLRKLAREIHDDLTDIQRDMLRSILVEAKPHRRSA